MYLRLLSEAYFSLSPPGNKKAEEDIQLWKKQEAAAKVEEVNSPSQEEKGAPKVGVNTSEHLSKTMSPFLLLFLKMK